MKTTTTLNPKVDAYIAKAQPFAQPILTHVRELAHKACPDVEEEIKWGMPFFVLRGVILANMAGFKQHCSLGFWGPEMQEILGEDGVKSRDAMGSLGRVTSLKDLPADKVLLGYYRQAAGFVASGQRTKSFTRGTKAPKPELEVPVELSAALKKNKGAAKVFAEFSPGADGSIRSGSTRPRGWRRRRRGWRRRWSGLRRGSNGTGSIRTAEGHLLGPGRRKGSSIYVLDPFCI